MIVDFTNVPAGSYVLGNVGPDVVAARSSPGWAPPHATATAKKAAPTLRADARARVRESTRMVSSCHVAHRRRVSAGLAAWRQ